MTHSCLPFSTLSGPWRRRVVGLLATILLTLVPSSPVQAWSGKGHRVIGGVADRLLDPTVKEVVTRMLRGKTLADVGTWADHIRPYRPETAPFHFVNIPIGETLFDPERHNKNGVSIFTAIPAQEQILADPNASEVKRVEALKFIVHLVGDLHQPLHVSDNGDTAGNRTRVRLDSGESADLHRVWDFHVVEFSGRSDEQYIDHLMQLFPTLDRAAIESGTVIDWGMATHALASTVWDLDAPAANEPGGPQRVGNAYLSGYQPLVERQLLLAGIRLALLVNRALANPATTVATPLEIGHIAVGAADDPALASVSQALVVVASPTTAVVPDVAVPVVAPVATGSQPGR